MFSADLLLAPAHVHATLVVVPGRDTVSPPQLAGNAPVLDVAHPLEIGSGPVLGDEPDAAVLHRRNRRFGQRARAHIPLLRQQGLDQRSASIAAGHHVAVILDSVQQPFGLQFFQDSLPGVESVQSAEACRNGVVERGGLVEYVDGLQAVSLADLEVVEVVGRGDLHAPGAELGVDVVVGNDGDPPLGQWQQHFPADKVPIALVVGMHGDGRIAQHRLGPRGGDHQEVVAVEERISKPPDLPDFFRDQHFKVRNRRVQHRVPVDQPLAAVDQPFLVEPHEDLGDRLAEFRVHGEAVAGPVHRCAQPPDLPGDGVPGVFLPFPHPAHEGVPPQFPPRPAFGVQQPLHDHLRGDAGVVGSHLPERVVAAHPVIADQRIHDGVLEGVAHVHGTGHVGRRNDDAIALAMPRRLEITCLLPAPVMPGFDLFGVVAFSGFVHGRVRWDGFPACSPGPDSSGSADVPGSCGPGRRRRLRRRGHSG